MNKVEKNVDALGFNKVTQSGVEYNRALLMSMPCQLSYLVYYIVYDKEKVGTKFIFIALNPV